MGLPRTPSRVKTLVDFVALEVSDGKIWAHNTLILVINIDRHARTLRSTTFT